MEEPYKSRIQNKIFDLSQITEASSALLIYLQQAGALIQHDVEIINSISLPIDKTYKLYEILLRDPGSAQHLLDGLRKTHQLGAVEILETATTPPVGIPAVRNISPHPLFAESLGFGSRTSESSVAPVGKFLGNWGRQKIVRPPALEPCPQLEDLHKYLLRSHSKGKPLILIQSKPKSDPESLNKFSRNYTHAYSQHFDENLLWIDAKNRQRLEETFLRIVGNLRASIDFPPHVNFGFNVDKSNCCAGSELDLKMTSDQIYKHFLGRKCLIIFENVEKDDPILLSVLPPNPSPPDFPTILLISPTFEKKDAWVTNAIVVELTEEDKIVKRSMYLGKVVGPFFQGVLETYNKVKEMDQRADQLVADCMLRCAESIASININL